MLSRVRLTPDFSKYSSRPNILVFQKIVFYILQKTGLVILLTVHFVMLTSFTQSQRNTFSLMWKRTRTIHSSLGSFLSFRSVFLICCPMSNFWDVVERTDPMIQCQSLCFFILILTSWPKIVSWRVLILMDCRKGFEMITFQFLYNTSFPWLLVIRFPLLSTTICEQVLIYFFANVEGEDNPTLIYSGAET